MPMRPVCPDMSLLILGSSIGTANGAQVVVDSSISTAYEAHPGQQEWVTSTGLRSWKAGPLGTTSSNTRVRMHQLQSSAPNNAAWCSSRVPTPTDQPLSTQ